LLKGKSCRTKLLPHGKKRGRGKYQKFSLALVFLPGKDNVREEPLSMLGQVMVEKFSRSQLFV
jgi:hypothetical protein